jgi:TnpA family transposase
MATSIKQGTATASLMLRKLGSYPRQNGLAVALRELGRIERTLFIPTGCKASSCAAACMPG